MESCVVLQAGVRCPREQELLDQVAAQAVVRRKAMSMIGDILEFGFTQRRGKALQEVLIGEVAEVRRG